MIDIHLDAIFVSRHVLRVVHVVLGMHRLRLFEGRLGHLWANHASRTVFILVTGGLRMRGYAVRMPILALLEGTNAHEIVLAFLRHRQLLVVATAHGLGMLSYQSLMSLSLWLLGHLIAHL